MYLPIFLIVASSAAYHFILKQASSRGALFLMLFGTYLLSAVVCLILYALMSQSNAQPQVSSVSHVFNKQQLGWMLLLALSLVGIELGYLLAYKSGGQVGQVSMIAQAFSMIVLLGVGFYIGKDSMTLTKALGVATGLISFALLAR